jgi:hypothetical protein
MAPHKKQVSDPAALLLLEGPPPFDGTILDAMDLASMTGPSWEPWRTFWRAVFALPMDATDLERFRRHTGRETPPSEPVLEAWQPIGRRGGKSRNMGLAAFFLGIRRDYRGFLAPGEVGVIPIIAADRKQAAQVLRYIKGLSAVERFAGYIGRILANAIELTTGVTIEIATASYRTTRGYTVVAFVADEIAFWRSEDSAEPDSEVLAALRPGMATVPDSLILAASSPYARKGELHRAVTEYYGADVPDVLVWNADTLSMHPGSPRLERFVAKQFANDPVIAASEYGQGGSVQFRADVESFADPGAIAAVTVTGRRELPRQEGIRYYAFTDPSGGSQDAWTLAVTHSTNGTTVLDALRERQPPFSPADVVDDYGEFLKTYGISEVEGDHYGGEFPRELFRRHGITYKTADRTKSDLYREWLPMLNAGHMELLDIPRLKTQFCGLERKVTRAGEDSITHAPGGHDDLANAAAGALVRAARKRPVQSVRFAL